MSAGRGAAIARTRVPDWSYKAEGAENLAIQYAGSDEPSLIGMVLRLRKVEKGAVSVADEVAFAQRVVAPLLGREFVLPMEVVDLEESFVEGVVAAVEAERPEHRRRQHADGSGAAACLPQRSAVLMPDCTLLRGVRDAAADSPTLCVEIKPKWGFLPSSGHLSRETARAKRRFCRYCMHQYLKHGKRRAAGGGAPPDGGYCPLQLFSGHPGPMQEALAALLASPQNNFRVFADGELVYGEDAQDGGAALERAARALLGERSCGADPVGAFLAAVAAALRASGVLDRVKALQELDRLDVEAARGLYEAHSAEAGAEELRGWDPDTVEGKAAMVPSLERVLRGEEALPGEASLAEAAAPRGRALALAAFSLSATAKDLSLMVALRRTEPPAAGAEAAAAGFSCTPQGAGPGRLRSPNLPPLAYSVAAVDLAVKPLARVPHYWELDARVVAHFLTHGPAGRQPCWGAAPQDHERAA
eukprot:tig00001628_g9435.t1